MKITYTNHNYSFHPFGVRCESSAVVSKDDQKVRIKADALGATVKAAKANAKRSIETQASWKIK